MSSTIKLKDEARSFEQQEDWGRAIELYRRALEQEAGDAELGLYNRIGDLYLRLGEPASAVEYYVNAADKYAEAGFLNNAIALCNKALRYEPERIPLYEKLGRLCAEQGFLTDARRWILEYAERLVGAGQMDQSLAALQEFAELSQDADVWAQLGRQYAALERSQEALGAFGQAARGYLDTGQPDLAEEVAETARELNPAFEPAAAPVPGEQEEWAADPSSLDPEALARPYEADLAQDTSEVEESVPEESDGPAVADLALESSGPEAEDVAAGLEASPLETMEEHGAGDFAAPSHDAPGEPLETTYEPAVAEPVDVEEAGPLPLLGDEPPMAMPEWTDVAVGGVADEDAPAASDEVDAYTVPIVADAEDAVEPEAYEAPDARDDMGFSTPIIVDDLPDPADAVLERATASDDDYAAEADSDPLAGLPTLTDEPEDAADTVPEEFLAPRTPEDRARGLIEEGREDDALDILEHAAGAAEERDATREALRLAEFMVELAPRSVRALRLRAEAAQRANDRDRLIPAYMALADRLHETGDPEAARGYYELVVDLDPGHAEARGALAPDGAAQGGDYVDLAELVGGDAEDTTRFVVEEEAPSGDEDQDFHEMLSQFRSKVTEHVAVEDTASHYDLGIAFKEMGLLDEAIAEFQTALRFGTVRLKVYEELGQCFMEKGDFTIAEKLLRQGTAEPASDPTELLGVNYHLGRCYEELGRPGDARDAYERVLSLDIDFEDVSERLARL
ncbi:MAG: tetratricopeptide repeat protein [Gemmatimonadota bacterium]